MESPLLTAFVILLKLLSIPVPVPDLGGGINLHGFFDQIHQTVHVQSYLTDILMDPNIQSYNGIPNYQNTYDFIVVGGGTAGSLVAGKLAEKYKVLVLEAGAEPFILSTVPMLNIFQWTSHNILWGYRSIPQKDNCFACKKKRIKYIQGKSLGGTMNMGHSVYSRGNVKDYDAWAEAANDTSWKYQNLNKYWRKIENYLGKYDESMSHGFSGVLKITAQQFQPLVREWLDAGNHTGSKLGDVNEPGEQGFSNTETTIYEGRRETTYMNILKKETWRHNLKIVKYATVEKIIFEGKTARGVIYHRAGQRIEVRAAKEIILTAGVFNTPKILMHSGIGPEEHLREMDISVKIPMEHVGRNLQDQPCTMYGPISVFTGRSFLFNRNLTFASILEYHLNQSGPLTSNLVSGISYISTDKDDENYPNIYMALLPVGVDIETQNIYNAAFDLKESYMHEFLKDMKDTDAVWCKLCLVRSKSRGYVRLQDDHWNSDPMIDPKFYDNPQDMIDIVDGLKFASRLFETKPWIFLEAKLSNKKFPGCESYQIKTPTYFECLANHLTFSSGSLGGTCRMGIDDTDSVVNSQLQVHNIKRLRIADASVMPTLPNGMAGTAVLAIAEKAAELLIEKWDMQTSIQRDLSTE